MELDSETIWAIYSVIGIAVFFTITYLYERKRTAALENTARKLGFSFSKTGRKTTSSKHKNFKLFSLGYKDSMKIKNEMWGKSKDDNISIFGYSYEEMNGTTTRTNTQTVLSIEYENLNLPLFQLEPKTVLHKVGKLLGKTDIHFESYPIFSKLYLLTCDDEKRIRDIFTSEVIQYFEQNEYISIEGQGNILIFYKYCQRCKPDEISPFFEQGQKALSLIAKRNKD